MINIHYSEVLMTLISFVIFFYMGKFIFYASNIIPEKYFNIYDNDKNIKKNQFKLITELLCATLSTSLWLYCTFTIELACCLIILWSFTLLFLIDLKYFLLPNMITLPLIWIGLIINTQEIFILPKDAILGAVIGYTSLLTVSKVFKYIKKKEGLGMGDCKLFSVFGAWWGIHSLLPILFVASILGSIIGIIQLLLKNKSLSSYFPFGPYLITGAIFYFCTNFLPTY